MIWKNREREVGEESGGAMAFAFGRATPSLRQAPLMCLDNPVPGNIIFSLNGEHHLLLKVLHFRVDKRILLFCGLISLMILGNGIRCLFVIHKERKEKKKNVIRGGEKNGKRNI